MTTIYVDNAATTKTSRTAIEAMLPYMDKIYGNPSSLHSVGQAAADALRKAREEAAEVLGCEPNEITFTSGAQTSNQHGAPLWCSRCPYINIACHWRAINEVFVVVVEAGVTKSAKAW